MIQNKIYLPDTNYILRYLLADDKKVFEEVSEFFEKIKDGSQKADILEGVLVECVYILLKYYEVPKKKIEQVLSGLLVYKGIVSEKRETFQEALKIFAEKNLDIVDCILIASATKTQKVKTFDKKLQKQL